MWRVTWQTSSEAQRGGLTTRVEHKHFHGPDAEMQARRFYAKICQQGWPEAAKVGPGPGWAKLPVEP